MKAYERFRLITGTDLPSGMRFVLTVLADYLGSDGDWARPSVATIASRTGYTERTVGRHLAQAVDRGLLEAREVRGWPTRYRFVWATFRQQPITKPQPKRGRRPDTPDTVSEVPPKPCHPRHDVTPDMVSDTPDTVSDEGAREGATLTLRSPTPPPTGADHRSPEAVLTREAAWLEQRCGDDRYRERRLELAQAVVDLVERDDASWRNDAQRARADGVNPPERFAWRVQWNTAAARHQSGRAIMYALGDLGTNRKTDRSLVVDVAQRVGERLTRFDAPATGPPSGPPRLIAALIQSSRRL